MWTMLLKPLMGVDTNAISGYVETKKIKGETKIAEIKAEKKRLEDIATGKIKWEQSAVDQMKGSWKDEFFLLALMIPAICVFIGTLPEYYTHLLYLACSVSLGVRVAPGIKGLLKK